jgi:hypothetical protein
MQHPIKVILVQEAFTARTPQMVLAVSVIITATQTQAKIIMLGTGITIIQHHITREITTLDMDITKPQHHITREITTLDMDITPGTQDITLVHILNQQELRPRVLDRGHPQQTRPTYIMHPTQRHTHLFTTPDTSHSLQQTIMLDSLAPMP